MSKKKAAQAKAAGDAKTQTSPPKPQKVSSNRKRARILNWLVPILLALLMAYLSRDHLFRWKAERATKRPDPLLNYPQFRAQYARLRKPTAVEDSRRHLLFIMDLILVGTHNISYLLTGKETYVAHQTPFRSDRTVKEQGDIIGQLEDFNMTQIMLNFESSSQESGEPIDRPVSFPGSSSSSRDTERPKSTLKKGSKMAKWVSRTLQGDAHFEIPDLPLDGQPDADKITHIDVDQRDCSNSIHDQGHCGACYAFSWISYVEWHYCRQTSGRRHVDFSEQHLIDCGHLSELAGCREGFLADAKKFSEKYGLHLEENYPYKGKKAKVCEKPNGPILMKVVDFTRIKVIREEWEEVLREQPILVQVHLPSDVMSYHRGVHPGKNCDKNMAHGMLLVGHGREEGIPYWILKNSMGAHWGENGYLRLSREAPMSQCFGTGFIAKFKFESLDSDAYYDFYDNLSFEPSVHIVGKPEISKGALDWFQGTNVVNKDKAKSKSKL